MKKCLFSPCKDVLSDVTKMKMVFYRKSQYERNKNVKRIKRTKVFGLYLHKKTPCVPRVDID